MFNKVIEKLMGNDDVERVAEMGDLQRLNDYLKTRRLLFPKKPMRFLDAALLRRRSRWSCLAPG
jgi:hypothetical protein